MSRTRMDGQARQPTGCSETQSGEAGTRGRDVGDELLKGRRQVLNLTGGWDFVPQRGSAGVIQAKGTPKVRHQRERQPGSKWGH